MHPSIKQAMVNDKRYSQLQQTFNNKSKKEGNLSKELAVKRSKRSWFTGRLASLFSKKPVIASPHGVRNSSSPSPNLGISEKMSEPIVSALHKRSLSISSSDSSSIESASNLNLGSPSSSIGFCSTTSIAYNITNSERENLIGEILDVDESSDCNDVMILNNNDDDALSNKATADFKSLRFTYLLVTLAIFLADGLQGTHLYVLYESYGYSVASLYCLGFVAGGLMSPVTGPLIDKIGRKKAAILYCVLEIFINKLEQYPLLLGLIVSRMIGGFTTNILSTVFEAWLDTEYRTQGLDKRKYEIIMRDSVIVSNTAAILSGYLAHVLAEHYGAIGPFHGAVTCTTIALVVVTLVWNENYGDDSTPTSEQSDNDLDKADNEEPGASKSMVAFLREAFEAFKADSKMLRVGILQGLTTGCIHIFIFLWAPALRQLSESAPAGSWGLDSHGEPAYGLIFGAFMAAGVFGGFAAPLVRKGLTSLLTPSGSTNTVVDTNNNVADSEERPMAVELLAGLCYLVSASLMVVPCVVSCLSPHAFTWSLSAFLVYEVLIGVFLPCEGVIRSLYFPANARGSVMALPRIIVNAAVALGVASTNYISLKAAFVCVSVLLVISSVLQLSLISSHEWQTLYRSMGRFLPSSSSLTTHPETQKVKTL